MISAYWTEFHINGHVLADTTNIENAIMPPPRGAMGPARNRRRLNWPVPIAPRGGSAEVARKFYFLINTHALTGTTNN